MSNAAIYSKVEDESKKEKALKDLNIAAEKTEKVFGIFSVFVNLIISIIGQIISLT